MSKYNQARAALQRRRDELSQRQQRVERDLARADEPLSADFSEQAVQVENDETLQEIARAARQEIVAIDAALQRILLGTYGICTGCGRPIASDRLAVIPHASHCSACAP